MTPSPRIPVLVIGGYLGAGKTTLINEILQNTTQRIAVVVNDFGSVNIDAALIAEKHDDTIELTNGCICCAVGESLADVLFAIADRPALPELVIIEASGVANPASIAAFAHIDGFHHLGNVVLVDAANALETANNPLVGRTFALQVQASHLLAITKTDIASAQDIEEVQTLITSLAPHTATVLAPADVLAFLVEAKPSVTIHSDTRSHDSFSSRTHHFPQSPSREELVEFLSELPRSVVRAKGIVELLDGSCVLVQQTGNHQVLSEINAAPTGIVLISLK